MLSDCLLSNHLLNNFCRLLLSALMVFTYRAYADCNFDDFPVMADMRVQVVMDNVVYNDRPMMVRNFNVEQSAEQVVNYYRRQWRDASVDSQVGAWRQISTLTKKCLMTVQYAEMPGAGTFGRLVISNIPNLNATGQLGTDLKLPSGTIVVSDTRMEDGPKKGRVTLLTSEGTVDQVVHFYRSQKLSDGWGLENEFREQGHAVLVFRKRLNESNIVITPAGDATQILINEVEVR
jgi:hypothetical protein